MSVWTTDCWLPPELIGGRVCGYQCDSNSHVCDPDSNLLWPRATSFTTKSCMSCDRCEFIASGQLEFPQMKQRRTSYEWFIPKGILKRNWMSKHLELIPSVVVIFVELDWNDPDFNEKKKECASRVQSVRAILAGRGTKIAI